MPQIGGHAVLRRFIAILSLAVIASAAQAQTCGPVDHAAAIAASYLKREPAKSPGAAILGHPLNAVIYVAGDLASCGQRLKAGDVIRLGSFGRALPPKTGLTAIVHYDGLPVGPLSVSVTFE
jgi:2-keto-4-pentenoate hydratase